MAETANGRFAAIGLGFIAGYADATGFLRWHAFGANMTGNTVLLGIAMFGGGSRALTALVPILAFFSGSMIAGALLVYARPAVLLVLEAAVLLAAAFSQTYVSQLGFLALGMGIQNTSVSKFEGVQANTSFITGNYGRLAKTLAQIVLGRAAADDRRTVFILAPLIVSYAFGAFAGALCSHYTRLPLLLTVPLVLALAYAAWRGAFE